MEDELRRENAELRELVRGLILTEQAKKTLWPGEEGCPVLDLPHPCACGNVIIERFLFAPDTFQFSVGNTMKVEGTPREVSLHSIDFHAGGLACRECGRKLVRKWESTN